MTTKKTTKAPAKTTRTPKKKLTLFERAMEKAIKADVAYEVDYNLICDVAGAVSKDDCCYYLGGVYIHDVKDKRIYAATDGHILFVAETKRNGDKLPVPLIIRSPFKKEKSHYGIIHKNFMRIVNKETVMFGSGDSAVVGAIIDATYPDYTKVIPDAKEVIKCYVGFNPTLMAKVSKFVREAYLYKPLGTDESSPLMWKSSDGKRTAVLMPVRLYN